ncbi:AraC-like DNA-binding protein [Rhizobium tibeticum]|uniref:helix-turn-helix domain-containing protein n=1 Tax=Rhizobium tibeticum TaxID=501024 RepID=UPI0027804402|nr:AraC family transcriptional regulator [Rhizobium tibeticum]MDP9810032.1 AraC-like DNA-binding protein [Rhizobium tibeticum]
MMHATRAVLANNDTGPDFAQVASASDEVSRLVMRALTCVNRDEAIAIDLMKKASILLRPHMEIGSRGRNTSGGLAPWQVKRLKQYIDEQLAGSISLNDLAQLVKLSTSYFSAAFKVSFGTSPHNYIVSRRVDHAKNRMANSNASLSEIALDCGLADQAHLSRIFRRATGTTPSAWRRYSALPDKVATF